MLYEIKIDRVYGMLPYSGAIINDMISIYPTKTLFEFELNKKLVKKGEWF